MNRTLLPLLGLSLALTACNTSVTQVPASDGMQASSVAAMASSSSLQASSSSKKAAVKITVDARSSKSAVSSARMQSSSSLRPKAGPQTTDAEWKVLLTANQYAVLRQAGTETPFTSPLVDEHRKGTFVTADCGDPVFRSEQKFDSGTGWPSFWAPIKAGAVTEKKDTTGGMVRTEVLSRCGGHLGHVFDDGPQPTGLRYCMNGLALKFIPVKDQ
jgi:peptide-methionine (R)-S-oxide reductase